MTEYRRALGILFGFLIALEGALAVVFIGRPAQVGDEAHLLQTISQFGQELSLRTIQHYNQMSPPLPLILYAMWGHVFSFDVGTLRWLSVVVAFAAYLVFFQVVYAACRNAKLALAATVYLALIPYMLGFSIYVLTDMWAILCVVLGCWSIQAGRPALLGLASAAGLLCR
jgi:hypothetical protein